MKKIIEMTVKELKEMAKEAKVKNWWLLKKDELIAELEKIEAAKKAEKKATEKKAKKATKKRNNEGPTGHKEVTNFYVLKIETKEKGFRVNDEIGSCKTLKAFIKALRKEKIVSLEVYKMGMNYLTNKNDIYPTRRSAWV